MSLRLGSSRVMAPKEILVVAYYDFNSFVVYDLAPSRTTRILGCDDMDHDWAFCFGFNGLGLSIRPNFISLGLTGLLWLISSHSFWGLCIGL